MEVIVQHGESRYVIHKRSGQFASAEIHIFSCQTWVNQLDLAPSTLKRLQLLIYYFSIESGLQMTLMGFDLELYELDNDRRAMWWVVERLSERAWLLLKILSDGAESLDAKLIRILGKLAGVAAQVSQAHI
jgi:hypothetical protein